MSNKRKNIFYIVLGSLVILLGLFMFQATRDITLPSNAKKEGNMIHIDLSDGATNEAEKKEALFVVPERFTPDVSERGFAFNFKFPDGTPYTGNESPVPFDRVRVVVEHKVKIESMRSKYILLHTQPKDGLLKNLPYFVESKDGVEIYKYDYGKAGERSIGTYFKFVAADGNNVLAQDSGDWASAYQVDRKFSSHIELTYMLKKSLVRDPRHFVEDVTAVDNAVLKLVQSFQSK
jgi:hypothetical protein